MNDIKKAALVEEGQPADLTAQRKATEAYHADGNLSNERDRALEWLRMMAEASKHHEFTKDIWVCGLYDGVCIKGAEEIAKIAGLSFTIDNDRYDTLRIEYFVFDGVQFYELFEKGE